MIFSRFVLLIFLLLSLNSCSWFQSKEKKIEKDIAHVIEDIEKVCKKLDAEQCYAEVKKILAKNKALTDTLALSVFIKFCNKASKNGSAQACQMAGKIYQKGEVVAKDDAKAINFFTKACNLDHKTGCFDAATAYKEGTLVKGDIEKADQYFTYACSNLTSGDTSKGKACTQKGLILLTTAKKDEKNIEAVYQAFDFFQKGCKNNSAQGCFQTGEAYRTGRGVAGSEDFAKQYYQMGCDGKFAESCLWSGNMNTVSNPKEATQYYFTGCSLRNAESCFELAERYRLGKAISQNLDLAQITYQQVCSDTMQTACYWQARLMQQQIEASTEKPEQDKIDSLLAAYQMACTNKLALACYQLALITQKAQWVDKDPPQVAQYLSHTCNESAWLGCFDLALLYETGNGVVQTPKQAAQMYKKTCQASAETPITRQLQPEAKKLAKNKQWQLHACWQLAQMYWQYPEKKSAKEEDKTASSDSNEGDIAIKETAIEPVAKDNKTALIYFDKACQFGWLTACLDYAFAADKGIGIEQDAEKAFNYYATGCALDKLQALETASLQTKQTGDAKVLNALQIKAQIKAMANACYNLAVNYRDGIGTDKNTAKANALFKQSCELKQSWACYNYALALGDSNESYKYLQQACDLGLATACARIGGNDT